MIGFLRNREWNWLSSGILLGLVFFVTVAVVKPIGVSTQFVILDGIVWNSISKDLVVKDEKAKKGYSSPNTYLNKSGGKYAKNIANPVNYSFIFVIAMFMGGFLAYRLQSSPDSKEDRSMPKVWRDNFGSSSTKRYLFVFLGGFLVLVGARLAGGCSSGHMMSGMMQTSVSGYMFAIVTFLVAVPTARILYKR
ncbi:MAG: YeeE/YedE family protein [Sulfurovum sp.]|nr:YeeE/YedE family protein [Sulfurovum sp.]